jgi:hypothetical protein
LVARAAGRGGELHDCFDSAGDGTSSVGACDYLPIFLMSIRVARTTPPA